MIWRIYLDMALGTMLVCLLYLGDMIKMGILGDALKVMGHNKPPTAWQLAYAVLFTGLLWPVTWAIWLKDYDDSDGDWRG